MIFTNILLAVIAVLLLARVIIEIGSAKRFAERAKKSYCATSEVEHRLEVVNPNPSSVESTINALASDNWELISVHTGEWKGNRGPLFLFFTRKKIKNYMEE